MQDLIDYIYDPRRVEEILIDYPSLYQKLKDSIHEQQQSLGFPQCLKTKFQIYRIISNQHYPHLAEILKALESCISNGWEQPTLIKTRNSDNFSSALTELYFAYCFLKRGFKIRSFDERKASKSVPDILIESDTLSASIEVYSPQDWPGIYLLHEELNHSIKYLDVPWNFHFNINYKLIDLLNSQHELLDFDPWEFSLAYQKASDRWKTINPIISEIEKELIVPMTSDIKVSHINKSLNLNIIVKLTNLEKARSIKPERKGVFIGFAPSSYDPEYMFDRLVTTRVVKKVKKRQAETIQGVDLKILLADISVLGYTSEFDCPYYLNRFGKSLVEHLPQNACGLDIIIFGYITPSSLCG